ATRALAAVGAEFALPVVRNQSSGPFTRQTAPVSPRHLPRGNDLRPPWLPRRRCHGPSLPAAGRRYLRAGLPCRAGGVRRAAPGPSAERGGRGPARLRLRGRSDGAGAARLADAVAANPVAGVRARPCRPPHLHGPRRPRLGAGPLAPAG